MDIPGNSTTDLTTDKPPRERRWIPLSLRMFGVILLMVGVGSAFWIGVPAYFQHVAVQKIERMSDSSVIHSESFAPYWLRSWIGDEWMEKFSSVEAVNLRGEEVTGVEVDYIRDLPNVKRLNLRTTKVTDQDICHLWESPNLEDLDLCDTSVTDAGLIHLQQLKRLKHLNLAMTRVTDEGIMRLKCLHSLKTLNLNTTQVTEKGIAGLKSAIPGLEIGR